jgi:hypothetical protein
MDTLNYNFGQAFGDILRRIVEFLPQLLAAILILIIGYFISKGIARLVRRGLQRMRFDRALHSSSAGNVIARVVESPSKITGQIVFWLLFVVFISFAVSALNLPALNQLLTTVYSYVPSIIAAILIFLVASAISAGTAKFVQRVMGRSATARLASAVIPTIVMSLAVFMILNQLGIARDIVNILFTAIVGAAALGLALAFGLGGREVARGLLEQAVDSARANADQIKSDVRTGAANTKREVNRMKNDQ